METIGVVSAWALLAVGIAAAWWFGWRDPGRGERRCPTCWYDMGAVTGRKCPECGGEAKSERAMHRTRRRWGYVLVGLLCVVAAYPISRAAQMQRHGLVGLLPRLAVLAAWPELIDPPKTKLKPAVWWRFDQNELRQALDVAASSELSWLERRVLERTGIRTIRAGSPHAGVAQETLRILGPEIGGDGARVIMDLWLAGKLRSRGPGSGTCVFMELPESGEAFVEEAIAHIRKNPSCLAQEPQLVEWVLIRKGTIATIIEPLDQLLATAPMNVAGTFYAQLGTLPFPLEDAVRTARIFRFETKLGNMQLSNTLAQSGAAPRFIADYREALTERDGNRVSSALVGAARAGPALRELQPEIEALLQSDKESVRFQARVALAMILERKEDVEADVLKVIVDEPWASGGPAGAFDRKLVALAALCSGAWSSDAACEALIAAARDLEPSELVFTRQQVIEYILMDAAQARKHAAALNNAIASNQILAMMIGRRVHFYPAADVIAPGLERAADASTSQFVKRVLRGHAAEARSRSSAAIRR